MLDIKTVIDQQCKMTTLTHINTVILHGSK